MTPKPYRADDATSILIGLSNCDGWRGSVKNEDGAIVLATAVLYYIDCFYEDHLLDVAAESSVCRILNDWLKPEISWSMLPSTGVLCQHMFNAAWCDLSLPESCMVRVDDSDVVHEISKLVFRERPPFLPGLCQEQDAVTRLTMALPDLDGFDA